jgi:hypothetical protein
VEIKGIKVWGGTIFAPHAHLSLSPLPLPPPSSLALPRTAAAMLVLSRALGLRLLPPARRALCVLCRGTKTGAPFSVVVAPTPEPPSGPPVRPDPTPPAGRGPPSLSPEGPESPPRGMPAPEDGIPSPIPPVPPSIVHVHTAAAAPADPTPTDVRIMERHHKRPHHRATGGVGDGEGREGPGPAHHKPHLKGKPKYEREMDDDITT